MNHSDFKVSIDKTLCKQCSECKDYIYKRVDKNGNLVSFQYCKACEDIVKLSNWTIMNMGYVTSTKWIDGKTKLFHTFFKKNFNKQIDHIYGDRLDNRLRKLREINSHCNMHNRHDNRSSEYPGVCYNKNRKAWEANIQINNKQQHLGKYNNELIAYHSYVCKHKEIGRSINKETIPHKKYEEWVNNWDYQPVISIKEVA